MNDNTPFNQKMATRQETEVFIQIQKAVLEMAPKTIRFTYTKDDESSSFRHVEPYEVIGGDRAQLVCHDLDKDQTRRFFLDRMSDLQVTDTPFNARYPIRVAL